MNPDELEELLHELIANIQGVFQSGEVLSDEFQGELARTVNLLTERIDTLRQQAQQQEQAQLEEAEAEQAEVAQEIAPPAQPPSTPTGGNVPPLDAAPHESSNINAFRYNPESGELFVKFQGKHPSQNGPVYSYQGVPRNIYDVFRRGAVAPRTSGRNAWHTWREGVTPSHGAAMYALIREGNYPYQRIR